ncbi:putative late blight resistance protein R1A-10 isoform X2 [Salvia divinorum]|uniref:Late blight resistance protein R1A-10 isoform X2 n=1 Tax=Salvia divinorum TaxID=28513 RepID=A0ABD1GF24_SALDI
MKHCYKLKEIYKPASVQLQPTNDVILRVTGTSSFYEKPTTFTCERDGADYISGLERLITDDDEEKDDEEEYDTWGENIGAGDNGGIIYDQDGTKEEDHNEEICNRGEDDRGIIHVNDEEQLRGKGIDENKTMSTRKRMMTNIRLFARKQRRAPIGALKKMVGLCQCGRASAATKRYTCKSSPKSDDVEENDDEDMKKLPMKEKVMKARALMGMKMRRMRTRMMTKIHMIMTKQRRAPMSSCMRAL